MACLLAGFAIQYATLSFGWGLEVKSWPALIGFWVLSVLNYGLISLASAAMKSKD